MQAIFNFEFDCSKELAKHDAEQKLKKLIEKFLVGQVGIEASTPEELAIIQKTRCTLFSEASKTDRSFSETINSFQSLSNQQEEQTEPVFFVLMPIDKSKPCKDLNTTLIEDIIQQAEVFENAKTRMNCLQKNTIIHLFSSLEGTLHLFSKLLEENEVLFKSKLQKMVIGVKDLSLDESELVNFLQQQNLSPFSKRSLETWLSEFEKQCSVLSTLVSLITDDGQNNIQLCRSEEDLIDHMAQTESLVVFALHEVCASSKNKGT
jgi:hypothetical protein